MEEKMHTNGILLPRLVRKQQVAEILACSAKDIDRHRREWGLREIHLTQDPRSLRFFAEDVERLINDRLAGEENPES